MILSIKEVLEVIQWKLVEFYCCWIYICWIWFLENNLDCQGTLPFKSLGSISFFFYTFFSKDTLKWSKVTVKPFIMSQKTIKSKSLIIRMHSLWIKVQNVLMCVAFCVWSLKWITPILYVSASVFTCPEAHLCVLLHRGGVTGMSNGITAPHWATGLAGSTCHV